MKHLIVVGGATATGKTALAIELAQYFDTEILSADSRQFYREMSIGTAKPNDLELETVHHHFVNHLSIHDYYSVGDFEREALQVLDKIFETKDIAILVGGSGLYIQALCEGLDSFPEISTTTRDLVATETKSQGLLWLQSQLSSLDPDYYATVDQRNPARLRRALEVCLETGKPYSFYLNQIKPPRPFVPIYLLLDPPRALLYEGINIRVDQMISQGLEAEALNLHPNKDLSALKTVGYEEFFDYFEGKHSKNEAIDKIKQHTRNYAKRQSTWFGKKSYWYKFSTNDSRPAIEYIVETRAQHNTNKGG